MTDLQNIVNQRFTTIIEKGNEFLDCRYPIMGGAMTWLSENNLVSAISNAGAFGIIACGSMNPQLLKHQFHLLLIS